MLCSQDRLWGHCNPDHNQADQPISGQHAHTHSLTLAILCNQSVCIDVFNPPTWLFGQWEKTSEHRKIRITVEQILFFRLKVSSLGYYTLLLKAKICWIFVSILSNRLWWQTQSAARMLQTLILIKADWFHVRDGRSLI